MWSIHQTSTSLVKFNIDQPRASGSFKMTLGWKSVLVKWKFTGQQNWEMWMEAKAIREGFRIYLSIYLGKSYDWWGFLRCNLLASIVIFELDTVDVMREMNVDPYTLNEFFGWPPGWQRCVKVITGANQNSSPVPHLQGSNAPTFLLAIRWGHLVVSMY